VVSSTRPRVGCACALFAIILALLIPEAGSGLPRDAPWRLTVSLRGNGSGEVTSNPAGVACGSTCAISLGDRRLVTLTAKPLGGSVFSGWRGGCAGDGSTCTRVIDGDEAVSARFQLPCVVPHLLGATLSGARIAVRKAHCRIVHVSRRYSAALPGLVVAQAPAPGARGRPAAPVRVAVSRGPKPVTCKDLLWPVSGRLESPFGWRWGRMHEGIDIGVPYGTPIHVAAPGRVVYAGWEGDYGYLLVIDHGGGLSTAYAHQSRLAVSWGRRLSPRQVLGSVGCTGNCTGPHLHFEVRIRGRPVDPLRCLPRRG
jgi:hypothetical protein